MKKHNRFTLLQEEVISHIRNNAAKGTHLIVMTFGNDVNIIYNKKIVKSTDIEEALYKVNSLRPVDDWTYIAKAVDSIYSIMEKSKGKTYAYLVTDGINEPPPWTRESPLTLEEILRTHPFSVKNKNNYLYILTLGIKPGPFVEALKKETANLGGNINVSEKELPQLPTPKELEEIKVRFNVPKEIDAGKNVKMEISWDVLTGRTVPEGIKVFLRVKPAVQFSPHKWVLDRTSGKKSILFESISPGTYELSIKTSSSQKNYKIKVEKKSFTFKAIKKIIPVSVNLETKRIRLFAGKNKNFQIVGELKCGNKNFRANDSIRLNISSTNLEINPSSTYVKLSGKSTKFKKNFRIRNLEKGKYRAFLTFIAPSGYSLSQNKFSIEIIGRKINILPFAILLVLLVIFIFIFIYCRTRPKFPENLILAVKENDVIIKRESLRKLQPMCSSKLSAETIIKKFDVVPDFNELRYSKSGDIIKVSLDDKGQPKEEIVYLDDNEVMISPNLYIITEINVL